MVRHTATTRSPRQATAPSESRRRTGTPSPAGAPAIAGRPSVEPAISLREAVGFRNRKPVLRVDRLELRAGEVSAVIGPNGSGKSTLLHAIAGLLPRVEGEVRVLGRSPERVRTRIAYVLQATEVSEHLPVTVRDVVAMGRYGRGRRSRREDRVAVDAAIERLELGDLTGRHLGELSGGQRQRALVAQGLAQGGDVLLLDEPTTGLDMASAARIGSIIAEERAAGRCVVLATHALPEAARADNVVLLAGHVVATGPPEQVIERTHLRAAYGDRLVRVTDGLVLVDDGAHHHGETR